MTDPDETRTRIYVFRETRSDLLERAGQWINGQLYGAYIGTLAQPPDPDKKIPIAYGWSARQALRRGIADVHERYYFRTPVLSEPVPPPAGWDGREPRRPGAVHRFGGQ